MSAQTAAAAKLGATVVLTRAVRVELAKPLGLTWKELDELLFDRRAVMHHLLNAGVAHIWSSQYRGETVRALEAIKAELASHREWCRKEAGKRGKDERERERLLRRANMELSGAITDAVQRRCMQALKRWNSEKRANRLPSAKAGSPIFVRDGGWSLGKEGDRFVLGVRLVGATKAVPHPGKISVTLRGSTGKHWAALAQIAEGTVKPGNCQLVYDESAERKDGRKGKWYAILAYTEEKPIGPVLGVMGRGLIVHRGMRNFLYLLSTDGRVRRVEGGKFLVTRSRLNTRMQQTKRVGSSERGHGAKGHGVTRRYVTHDALDQKLKDVTKTFCQQSAAFVVKSARALGCTEVWIEDYGGQAPSEERGERRFFDHFPYYQLKQAIVWACKRDGYPLQEYAATFISSTCPRCDAQDAGAHNYRTGVFHCRACGFERGADWVAAYNGAKLAGVDLKDIAAQLEQQRRMEAAVREVAREREADDRPKGGPER
jgi:hypothetical protein